MSMKYTFEITIAGCSTDCLHCYVDGGPAPTMPYEDYLLCINKLKPVLDGINGDIAVTLGNEIFNHPRIKDIVRETYSLIPEYFTLKEVGINTTGISMMKMHRDERDELIDTLVDAGARSACLTIHGNEEHHNEVVRNKIAYKSLKKAADYFNSYGIELSISIMLNKYVVEDWNEIMDFLNDVPNYGAFVVVPLYMPTDRLREFQKIRAEYDDCMKLEGRLRQLGIDEDEFFNTVESYNERAVLDLVKNGFDYKKAEEQCPNWVFLNISKELDLYYGNAGARTRLIGNLKTSSTVELINEIGKLKPNYDYSAFYDLDKLPSVDLILERIQPLRTNYVYPNVASCLYSWFDLCSIPSIIKK